MVVKRQCSFCAAEIEPGTGMMFVKRDGTVFHFCTSSCRKQQLHLGRVGHRLKWTRAHALKRAAEQSSAERAAAPKTAAPTAKPKPRARAPTAAPPKAAEPAATPAPVATATAAAPATAEDAKPTVAPAKKPRKPRAKPAPAESG
jgi:large subunit ribosomal protein L24e